MSRTMKGLWAAVTLAAMAIAATAGAQSMKPAANRTNLLGEGVAVVGYDPVSYFPEGGGKPQKGLITLATAYEGATYRFRSKENLERFQADPAKYVPAYGAWCAWAVAELGKRVDVDPESYEIRDGRLLLFYRDPALDTRALWQKSPEQLAQKAAANWPALAK